MGETKIQMIALDRIWPHPDNPRKDLGDLTELADSIEKNGIMQNLTVTPGHFENGNWEEDGYTLLIGHRRAAAAKIARLSTVPCTIIYGSNRKEQIGIMLEENMQRADLTVREQAQGFQMMLDLGDTVEDVARKTGFSETTVRHRLNIAKLDQKAIEAAEEGGFYQISISDYMKLEKLPTVKMRNEVLRDVRDGRQLDYKVRDKLREIEDDKKAELITAKLKLRGVKPAKKGMSPWDSKYVTEQDISLEGAGNIKTIENPEECVFLKHYRSIKVLRERKKGKLEEKLSEYDKEQAYNKKRKKICREIQKTMDEKRRSFILRIANRDVMPAPVDHERMIIDILLEIAMQGSAWFSKESLMEYHSQKERWSMTAEEKEAEREALAGMGIIPKLLMCIDRFFGMRGGTDVESLLNYDGTVNEDRLRLMNMFYGVLKGEYGYVPDEEDLSMLGKTNDVFITYKDAKAAGLL